MLTLLVCLVYRPPALTLAISFACFRAYSPEHSGAGKLGAAATSGRIHPPWHARARVRGTWEEGTPLLCYGRLTGYTGREEEAANAMLVALGMCNPNSGPTRLHANSPPAAMCTLRTHYMHAPPPSPVAAGPSHVQSVSVLQMQLPANEGRGTNGSASMVRSATRRVGRSPCGILSANEGCSASSSAAPHIPTRIPLSGRRIYFPFGGGKRG